jgi:hypothetical protein
MKLVIGRSFFLSVLENRDEIEAFCLISMGYNLQKWEGKQASKSLRITRVQFDSHLLLYSLVQGAPFIKLLITLGATRLAI